MKTLRKVFLDNTVLGLVARRTAGAPLQKSNSFYRAIHRITGNEFDIVLPLPLVTEFLGFRYPEISALKKQTLNNFNDMVEGRIVGGTARGYFGLLWNYVEVTFCLKRRCRIFAASFQSLL